MYHYLYISKTTASLSAAEFNLILQSARTFNEANNITGMLLYCKGTFMQLLEGEKHTIHTLMDQRIALDDRHQSIYVVKETEVDKRSFVGWSMGFSNLDNLDPKELNHCTTFLEKGFTVELATAELDITHQLLLSFKEQQCH